jgi:hypothetical protein
VPIGRNGSGTAKPSRASRSSESRNLKRAPALAASRSRRSAASRLSAVSPAPAASHVGQANPAARVVAAQSGAVRGPAHRAGDVSAVN